MSDAHLITAVADGVLTATMSRPKRRNAMSTQMCTELTAALDTASGDPQVRVMVINGAAGHFTSGYDIMEFAQNPPTSADHPVMTLLGRLATFEKPLLAAVEGAAVGIGTTMLMHCDMIWAAENTRFELPFVRLGLVPEAGSSVLLPRLAGHARAAEILMLCEPFAAQTALEIGLINGVCADDALHAHVAERAQALTRQPAAALRQTKRLMKAPHAEALQRVMEAEGRIFSERLTSPEAMEAFTAFMHKRQPDFSRYC